MTAYDDGSTRTAGWYPDPDGLEQLRFYTGEQWTSHITIGPARPGSASSRPQRRSFMARIFEPKSAD